MYRIGVDIGGTFTDFALFDARGSKMSVHKRLTTPHDPSQAVTEGIDALLKRDGVGIADVSDVVHGTTLVTNAVIERKGAVTGMLATAGFSDILDMGFERRYDLFDLRVSLRRPWCRAGCGWKWRSACASTAASRRRYEAAVTAAATRFQELGVAAVAVCFLHAYANPTHEVRAAPILREAAPDLFVSASADVFPNMREFERWTTTTVNAFTQPMFDRYLERFEEGLAAQGFRGRLYIMASSGGTLTADTARRYPVRALESGPAAGVLMSAYHGRSLDLTNLLSFDMGGTTAKGALVRGGTPIKRYSMEVARVHEFRQGSGLTIRIPAIDMIEIGAGGGSIAGIDDRGLLRVGPRSAGADPGPACYGRGGTKPTLTDANLVLGFSMPASSSAAPWRSTGRQRRPPSAKPWPSRWASSRCAPPGASTTSSARTWRAPSASTPASAVSTTARAAWWRSAARDRCMRSASPGSSRYRAWCSRWVRGVMSALGMLISPLAFEMARSRRIHVTDIDAADFAGTFAGAGEGGDRVPAERRASPGATSA